ncbi:MAG: hypothetical protein H6734_23020 [Alphaproteobacteria bacterium]|nr:hypothetical protein [Alphaproteobacteria bacterium]
MFPPVPRKVWMEIPVDRVAEVATVLDAPRSAAPLTTWREVADAVGVSEDTLLRKRRKAGSSQVAWFATEHEAREFWKRLTQPDASQRPAGRTLSDVQRGRKR